MKKPRSEDLAEIETAVWNELAAAVGRRTHPWHLAVLATVDGGNADARLIVLRELDREARELVFFTDARSPKVRQLGSHPQGVMVLWSESLGWQLRLTVQMEVETAGLAVSSRWAHLKMKPAAHDYLSPLPPGSPLANLAPERGTREYFALVRSRVQSIDWLDLHPEGYRRACFDEQGRRWLAP